MNKQSLITGSLILAIAGMIAKVLGFAFRWPVIMKIGDEGIGYYQLSYPLYMFFVAIASGVPVAVSKIISEKNAVGDIDGAFEVVKESSFFMLLLGGGTSLILFLFAKPIINFLRWDMKSYYALVGISMAPIAVSATTIFRGFFQGFQNMTPTAVSQVIEQIGRVIVGVSLVFLFCGTSIELAAGGAAFGAAAGGVLATIYLYFEYRKVKKSMGIKKIKTNTALLNTILKTAIPISIGATVGTVMTLIDSILVPRKLLESGLTQDVIITLYGQLSAKASVLVNVPLTLSMALCTSLIPIIASNYKINNKLEVESKVNMAVKIAFVISIPAVLGLFFMAEPIMKLIFFDKYEGIGILKYLSLTIPFIIITQATNSVLQATNHYICPVVNLCIGAIVKIILTLILVPIPSINIYGAVISSIVAYITVATLNIIMLKIKVKLKINFLKTLIKPLISGLFMIICTMMSYTYIMSNSDKNKIACLVSIAIGGGVYVIFILVLRVFKLDEIKDKLVNK